MKLIVLLFIFLSSCVSPEQPPKDSNPPVTVMTEVAEEIQNLTPMLVIGKCSNCSVDENAMLLEAAGKLNFIVKTQCFKEEIMKRDLIQTGGKSNIEVYKSLIHSNITVDIEMYWSIKKVLGYTYPNVMKEWINRRYAKSWGICELASLLAHETSHKVGYGHDFYNTKSRQYSVPYSINHAFTICCKN